MNIQTFPSDSAAVVNLVHWTESRLRHLEPGERYCLNEILAMISWSDEDQSYIAQARRFAWLIITDRLPFVIAGTRGGSQNLYCYTPWRLTDGKCAPFQVTELEY
jgi:hypothetical protein